MNPGDSTWWWTHAFDAIASGLVTASAVLLTLWWERRRGTDSQLRIEMAAIESLLWEWSASPSEWPRLATRLSLALVSAAAAAQKSARALIRDLSDASVVLMELRDAHRDGQGPSNEALDAYHESLMMLIVIWKRDQRAYVSRGNRDSFRPGTSKLEDPEIPGP